MSAGGQGLGEAAPWHCPACRVVAELVEHRDATADGWSVRRVTLNFAIVVARRACPDYEPAGPEVDAS